VSGNNLFHVLLNGERGAHPLAAPPLVRSPDTSPTPTASSSPSPSPTASSSPAATPVVMFTGSLGTLPASSAVITVRAQIPESAAAVGSTMNMDAAVLGTETVTSPAFSVPVPNSAALQQAESAGHGVVNFLIEVKSGTSVTMEFVPATLTAAPAAATASGASPLGSPSQSPSPSPSASASAPAAPAQRQRRHPVAAASTQTAMNSRKTRSSARTTSRTRPESVTLSTSATRTMKQSGWPWTRTDP
jgi:hypothetical protein